MAKKRKGSARALARDEALSAAMRTKLPPACDVAVIGGGASGLAAAIAAAEMGARVVVLERARECGRTILATGNGRCNLAHTDLCVALSSDSEKINTYHNADFAREVMGGAPTAAIVRRFAALGLDVVEEDGRLYPASRVAESVRTVLLAACERLGVILAAARNVEGIVHSGAVIVSHGTSTKSHYPDDIEALSATGEKGNAYVVAYDELWGGGARCSLCCRSLILATGGLLTGGAPVLGRSIVHTDHTEGIVSDLTSLGIMYVPPRAVLAPLVCTDVPKSLDGRRARCVVTLRRGEKAIACEAGEVLFRGYGLSGIVIFDVSRIAEPGDVVSLDLAPGYTAADLSDRLRSLREAGLALDVALSGIVDPIIASELCARAAAIAAGACAPCAWCEAARLIKALSFTVKGTADASYAQVTRGGIDVAVLNAATLEACAPQAQGLFCCGEAVDVDGPCGGYNLAWAWESGERAGYAAARHAVQ